MQEQSPQTLSTMFSQAQLLFRQGQLSKSKMLFENILQLHSSSTESLIPSLHYNCLLNLSTIYMQQNDFPKAKQSLHKAIKLNPQRYQAFYNLSLVHFYSKQPQAKPIESLKHCLSLLYLQLGILTGSLKLLNKSISFYNQNAKAYIHRALYYENNQKIKLASNQFQKLTFQHDEYQFSHKILAEIYAQKAMFFRRNANLQKMEQNLVLYRKYWEEAKQEQKKLPEKIANLLNPDSAETIQNQLKRSQMHKKMTQMVKQVQQLIHQIQQERNRSKQSPPQNLEKSVEEKHQIKLSESPQKSNFHILHEPIKAVEPNQQEESLLDEQIFAPSNNSIPQNDQNPSISISINEDEDSAILNQKIEELQRQIKQSGGNVPEIKDLSRNSDEQNFLEFEIEKTIEEINNKKMQEEFKTKPSIEKLPELGKSTISESKISSNGDIRDSLSMRSKLTETYEIDLEEMKNYKSFTLEIRSVTMFEQNGPRKESFAKTQYLSHEMLTEKCKNDKLTWNHHFDEMKIEHQNQVNVDDDSKYRLSIEVHAKEGGWLSWNNDVLLATGAIKLTDKGSTKCTLENKGKKVGILYYKIKMHKFDNEKL